MAEENELPPPKEDGVPFAQIIWMFRKEIAEYTIDRFAELAAPGITQSNESLLQRIWKGVTDWDEKGEGVILGLMDTIYKALGLDPKAAKHLSDMGKHLSLDFPGMRTGSALYSLFMMAGIILKIEATIPSPFLERSYSKLIIPNRPDLQSLLQHKWRFGEVGGDVKSQDWWDDAYHGLGFDATAEALNANALRPWLDRSDIAELFRRGKLTFATATAELQKLGWADKSQILHVTDLAETLLDRGTLDELRRRGVLSGADYRERLSWLGLWPKSIELAEKAVPRLLGPAELLRAYHRGEIDLSHLNQLLKKAGYDAESRDILEWQSYEPLPPETIIRAFHRGMIDKAEANKRLQRLGFSSEDSPRIIDTSYLLPSPADLVRFGVREVYTPAIRKKFGQDEDYPDALTAEGRKLGFSRKTLGEYWAAHWELPATGQAFDMMHRGLISQGELDMLLRAKDVMPFWRDKLLGISYRLIPRRSLPRLIKQKLITLLDLTDRFKALGYSPKNSRIMGLSAVKAAEEPTRTLAKSEVIDAYANELIEETELVAYFRELDYDAEAIEYYKQKAEKKKERAKQTTNAATLSSETKRIKELNKQEVLRGFNEGLLDSDAATEYLSELGFPSEAVEAMLSYELFKAMRENRDAHTKQVKRVFDAGLLTVPEAEQKLIELGYVPTQGRRLTNLWRAERDADTALATQQNKPGTKADYESWLKLGIIDVPTWVEAMRRLQYTDETISYNLQEIAVKL